MARCGIRPGNSPDQASKPRHLVLPELVSSDLRSCLLQGNGEYFALSTWNQFRRAASQTGPANLGRPASRVVGGNSNARLNRNRAMDLHAFRACCAADSVYSLASKAVP